MKGLSSFSGQPKLFLSGGSLECPQSFVSRRTRTGRTSTRPLCHAERTNLQKGVGLRPEHQASRGISAAAVRTSYHTCRTAFLPCSQLSMRLLRARIARYPITTAKLPAPRNSGVELLSVYIAGSADSQCFQADSGQVCLRCCVWKLSRKLTPAKSFRCDWTELWSC